MHEMRSGAGQRSGKTDTMMREAQAEADTGASVAIARACPEHGCHLIPVLPRPSAVNAELDRLEFLSWLD